MPSRETVEMDRHVRALDDHALLRLVAVERSDWRPEAIEVACAELQRRGLAVSTREEYCRQFRSMEIGADGFCAVCRQETTDESPGNTSLVNLVGTRLVGGDNVCPACGSVVQTKWFWIGVPIIPLGRYSSLGKARLSLQPLHWAKAPRIARCRGCEPDPRSPFSVGREAASILPFLDRYQPNFTHALA